jgi:nitric oxide reductase subunit B
METLVWMRVPGDILFAIGSLFLAWYAFRLLGRGKPQASEIPGTAAAR